MYAVAVYSEDDCVTYRGMFDSYDEANDYVLLGVDVEDFLNLEIIEIEKVTSAVV